MSDRFRVTAMAVKRLPYFQLKIIDTKTGGERCEMTDIARAERNRGRAQRKAWELQVELNAHAANLPERMSWEQFRGRVSDEYLLGRRASTDSAYEGILDSFENHFRLTWLRQVDTDLLRDYCLACRRDGLSEATVQKHIRHLLAVFRWAQDEGLLAVAPAKPRLLPQHQKLATRSKGRALTNDEIPRYFEAITQVCSGERAAQIDFLVSGILATGFRLGEARLASWHGGGIVQPVFPSSEIDHPIWCFSDQQKNGKVQEIAMTPECADLLDRVPPENRNGWIFSLPGRNGQLGEFTLSKTLSDVGKKAEIVVSRSGDGRRVKFASAQDLRRTFAQKYAYKVKPGVLQHLMRHKSHQTTDRFYLRSDAQQAASSLWRPPGGQ